MSHYLNASQTASVHLIISKCLFDSQFKFKFKHFICASLTLSVCLIISKYLSTSLSASLCEYLTRELCVHLGGYQYFLHSLYFMSHDLKVSLTVLLSEYLCLLNILSVSHYLKVSLGVSQCIKISVS